MSGDHHPHCCPPALPQRLVMDAEGLLPSAHTLAVHPSSNVHEDGAQSACYA